MKLKLTEQFSYRNLKRSFWQLILQNNLRILFNKSKFLSLLQVETFKNMELQKHDKTMKVAKN